MKTTVMNPVKAFTLIALGPGIAAMGIYVANADDAPGATVIGMLLVVVGVVLGVRAVTDSGIIFTTIEREQDVLDFYGFRDRVVRRLDALPFRFSRIAGLGGLAVSRDGRWALASVTDRWESDIMVAGGVR